MIDAEASSGRRICRRVSYPVGTPRFTRSMCVPEDTVLEVKGATAPKRGVGVRPALGCHSQFTGLPRVPSAVVRTRQVSRAWKTEFHSERPS